MANLLSNVAFDTGVSGQLAHQVVKTAEALTPSRLMSIFDPLRTLRIDQKARLMPNSVRVRL